MVILPSSFLKWLIYVFFFFTNLAKDSSILLIYLKDLLFFFAFLFPILLTVTLHIFFHLLLFNTLTFILVFLDSRGKHLSFVSFVFVIYAFSAADLPVKPLQLFPINPCKSWGRGGRRNG